MQGGGGGSAPCSVCGGQLSSVWGGGVDVLSPAGRGSGWPCRSTPAAPRPRPGSPAGSGGAGPGPAVERCLRPGLRRGVPRCPAAAAAGPGCSGPPDAGRRPPPGAGPGRSRRPPRGPAALPARPGPRPSGTPRVGACPRSAPGARVPEPTPVRRARGLAACPAQVCAELLLRVSVKKGALSEKPKCSGGH